MVKELIKFLLSVTIYLNLYCDMDIMYYIISWYISTVSLHSQSQTQNLTCIINCEINFLGHHFWFFVIIPYLLPYTKWPHGQQQLKSKFCVLKKIISNSNFEKLILKFLVIHLVTFNNYSTLTQVQVLSYFKLHSLSVQYYKQYKHKHDSPLLGNLFCQVWNECLASPDSQALLFTWRSADMYFRGTATSWACLSWIHTTVYRYQIKYITIK